MKKFVFLLTIIFAVMSVIKFCPCDSVSYIAEKSQSAPAECSEISKCAVSTAHTFCSDFCQTLYDYKTFNHNVVLQPAYLGQIFFQHTNIKERNYLPFIEKPPTLLT